MVVRPTSETIINTYFSKWVQSYRDLPLLVNQWANVVRWEFVLVCFYAPRSFCGRGSHLSRQQEDARQYTARILTDVYADFMESVLAMAVVPGRKTRPRAISGRHQHPHL